MSDQSIYLRIKALFQDSATAGLNRLVSTAGAAGRKVSGVLRGMAPLFSTIGEQAGKAGRAISGIAGGFATMGIAGAAIAGVSAGIDWLAQKLTAAKSAAAKLAMEMSGGLVSAFRRFSETARQEQMDRMNAALDKATDKAQRAAKAYDTLAAAALRVAKARDDAANAGEDEKIANLRLEKAKAVSGAKSADDAAFEAARYDVRIAEIQARLNVQKARQNVDSANAARGSAVERALFADTAVVDAREALAAIKREEALVKTSLDGAKPGQGEEWEKQLAIIRQKRIQAEKVLEDNINKSIAAEAAMKAAIEDFVTAQKRARTVDTQGQADVANARKSYADLVKAQSAAAKAELARNAQEAKLAAAERNRRIADGRRGVLNEANAALAAQHARAAMAGDAANAAWGLYRSPDEMKRIMQEEREDAKARRNFERDAERLQSRGDWRTARLNARDEATRRVILAREQEKIERDNLRAMQQQVADARRNLDDILAVLKNDVGL